MCSRVRIDVRILEASDVPQTLALSRAVGWNQTAADWALVIEMNPQGCFAMECDGAVVATTTTIRYGTDVAWIGMVLTHPDFRGRGYAHALMERALDHLSDVQTVKLDATAIGQPLYKKLGFVDECKVERWARPAQPLLAAENVVDSTVRQAEPPAPPLQTKHLPWVAPAQRADLDKTAFGADRGVLLSRLSQFEAASLEGAFAMGRRNRFGPSVSRSREAAEQLARWFLARHPKEELVWDLFPENNLAESLGFELSRRLTRMTRGRTSTGDNSLIYAGAGFEFG